MTSWRCARHVEPRAESCRREPAAKTAAKARSEKGGDKRHTVARRKPYRRSAVNVDDLIRAIMHSGVRSVPAAARAAGMSRRTFHRRLKESGLSFSKRLEEVRLATAVRLIDTDLDIREIRSR